MPRSAVLPAVLSVLLACQQTPPSPDRPSGSAASAGNGPGIESVTGSSRVVDLTVLVSESLPAHWGSNPPFARWTNNWFEVLNNEYGTPFTPSSAPYYSQRFVIDEHTGTQTDFPAHFIPPPGSGLPHAGPMGSLTGEKYPLDRLMGPAAVIDVTDLRDSAEPGLSAPISVDRIQAWEEEHGEIKAGEVILFHSGYSDAYYKPLPDGMRFTFEPLVLKSAPGWPAPTPEAVEYLQGKGVWHLGTDGASMGPVQGGQPTHVAGLQHGMSWEELLTNLGELPTRGAYYIALPLKIVGPVRQPYPRHCARSGRGARLSPRWIPHQAARRSVRFP